MLSNFFRNKKNNINEEITYIISDFQFAGCSQK